MENYLEKCVDIKVEIAALELLMEPEEAEVFLRYILKHSKRSFEIIDTRENHHLVASRRRWLEHSEERVALQERWQNDW